MWIQWARVCGRFSQGVAKGVTDINQDGYEDDDDIPWADPGIRKDYEAALGRLILAHNDVDLHLTRLVDRIISHLGDPPALAKLATGEFAKRVDNVRTLYAIAPDMPLAGIDLDEMSELNRLRNIVAHGHFDQNPFQGTYELITNKKTHADFSTERLDEITERLEKVKTSIMPVIYFWDD